MPNFSLGELMSLTTARLGRRADIPRSEVSRHVNLAYFEVANSTPHALQERFAVDSTASGQRRISLPPDFGEPINFSLEWSDSTSSSARSSHVTMQPISASQADAMGQYPTGTPKEYLLYNTWLEPYPSPNSAYSLRMRYRSMATDLVETDDVPSVSTPWRHAILLKSEELLNQYLGNDTGALFSRQQYVGYTHSIDDDRAKRQKAEGRIGVSMTAYRTPGSRRRKRKDRKWSDD